MSRFPKLSQLCLFYLRVHQLPGLFKFFQHSIFAPVVHNCFFKLCQIILTCFDVCWQVFPPQLSSTDAASLGSRDLDRSRDWWEIINFGEVLGVVDFFLLSFLWFWYADQVPSINAMMYKSQGRIATSWHEWKLTTFNWLNPRIFRLIPT